MHNPFIPYIENTTNQNYRESHVYLSVLQPSIIHSFCVSTAVHIITFLCHRMATMVQCVNYELLDSCSLLLVHLYHSFVVFFVVVHRQALAAHQVLAVAAPVQDPAVVEAAARAQAVVGAVVGQLAVVVVRVS